MKSFAASIALLPAASALAQPVEGDLAVTWNEGARDCSSASLPPLQVHRYEPRTFILRQNPCADFEAPLLYLLIGSQRALLIDSGAVADPSVMPLAQTVAELLPVVDGARLPLLVVHTHSHGDHHAGDAQLAALPGTEVVSTDPAAMQAFFGIEHWPDDFAQFDLGERVIEVLPVPGHEDSHVLFYDTWTAIAFTGDFLLPGRLLVDDLAAYRASALRAVEFLEGKPVTHVLGAHVELAATGELYPSGSSWHLRERAFALAKSDLDSLPGSLADFNGFYASYPNYTVVNPVRNLMVLALGVLIVFTLLGWLVRRWWKRRRPAAGQPP